MTALASSTTIDDVLEVVQDLAKMTAEGFETLGAKVDRLEVRMDGLEGRMDGLEGQIDGIEGRMDRNEGRLDRIEKTLAEHGRGIAEIKTVVHRIENEQQAQKNDIAEILDRLVVLEHKTKLNEQERREAKEKLDTLMHWAKKVSKQLDIPLNLT